MFPLSSAHGNAPMVLAVHLGDAVALSTPFWVYAKKGRANQCMKARRDLRAPAPTPDRLARLALLRSVLSSGSASRAGPAAAPVERAVGKGKKRQASGGLGSLLSSSGFVPESSEKPQKRGAATRSASVVVLKSLHTAAGGSASPRGLTAAPLWRGAAAGSGSDDSGSESESDDCDSDASSSGDEDHAHASHAARAFVAAACGPAPEAAAAALPAPTAVKPELALRSAAVLAPSASLGAVLPTFPVDAGYGFLGCGMTGISLPPPPPPMPLTRFFSQSLALAADLSSSPLPPLHFAFSDSSSSLSWLGCASQSPMVGQSFSTFTSPTAL